MLLNQNCDILNYQSVHDSKKCLFKNSTMFKPIVNIHLHFAKNAILFLNEKSLGYFLNWFQTFVIRHFKPNLKYPSFLRVYPFKVDITFQSEQIRK